MSVRVKEIDRFGARGPREEDGEEEGGREGGQKSRESGGERWGLAREGGGDWVGSYLCSKERGREGGLGDKKHGWLFLDGDAGKRGRGKKIGLPFLGLGESDSSAQFAFM